MPLFLFDYGSWDDWRGWLDDHGLRLLVILGLLLTAVHKQLRMFNTQGPSSAPYLRISSLGRALGGAVGLVVIVMLYLMVFKPWN